MGAGVFHGRVRDGIGCIIPAMTTGPPGRILREGMVRVRYAAWCCVRVLLWGRMTRPGVGFVCVVWDGSSIGRLVTLGCAGYPVSTCVLLTCWSGTALEGDLVWRGVSCLDAFSSYPVRT